jgi:hypothetical protein
MGKDNCSGIQRRLINFDEFQGVLLGEACRRNLELWNKPNICINADKDCERLRYLRNI